MAAENLSYQALTITSGMIFGDDKECQDRARFFEPGLIACVSDGVSSSPYAARAAELVTEWMPVVFNGANTHERLVMLCDLLIARRKEAQGSNEILCLPKGMSQAMQKMLRTVTQEKQEVSFQTTLVAAQFAVENHAVRAHIIKCGDSAFFAFSADGDLLSSSLGSQKTAEGPASHPRTKSVHFGPGDKILVRVEAPLAEYQDLVKTSGIQQRHLNNWLVCRPIDSCQADPDLIEPRQMELQTLTLSLEDCLLVPKYLYGQELSCSDRHPYRFLHYSSAIRPVYARHSSPSIHQFPDRNASTLVLPDHFYSGWFDAYHDQFPPMTHFILCSDGFYESFSRPADLWTWLQRHANCLTDPGKKAAVLEDLHRQLHSRGGDDDISFVWVHPRTASALEKKTDDT